ncbi:MAG: SCO family protein [Sphingomonadaceae bacterium]
MFRLLPGLGAILILCLSACNPNGEASQQPPLAGASIGGPFTLIDSKGKDIHWSDFAGKYRIVYFGYTYCPDVCPTDVQRMTQGLKIYARDHPEQAERIQPIFITVDPERDTPSVVDEFTHAFSDSLIGLTGTPEQINKAASAFRVFYSKGDPQPGGGYLVDHSNIVFLFDPDGKPLATLPTNDNAQAVAAELEKWVK